MSKFHSIVSRRDFMKGLGLAGVGLGTAAAASPVFHDLDEVTASPGGEWKRDYNTSQYMGRLVLAETDSHTIKFVALLDGYGNFDYLALWPVEE